MTTSLPGVWNLIKGSWDAFVKHWSLLVKYSAWIVLAVALQEVGALIPASQAGLQTSVLLIGGIAGVFVTLWASIRLFQVIFSLEDSKAVTEKTTATAMALILPRLPALPCAAVILPRAGSRSRPVAALYETKPMLGKVSILGLLQGLQHARGTILHEFICYHG